MWKEHYNHFDWILWKKIDEAVLHVQLLSKYIFFNKNLYFIYNVINSLLQKFWTRISSSLPLPYLSYIFIYIPSLTNEKP